MNEKSTKNSTINSTINSTKKPDEKNQMYMEPGVVLRVGELFLKGKNRHVFMDALVNNVKRAIKDRENIKLFKGPGRIFLKGSSDEDLLSRLRWVFGLTSYSPVIFCEKNIKEISKVAVKMALSFPAKKNTVFRIAARRSDKTFNYTSTDIGIIVGSDVNVATGFGVDLENPDLKIGVEIGKHWAFLWTEQISGGGGLPVGTSGRTVLLLSGGIDSPVAGHMIQKRGVELSAVYFHAYPYTSDGAKDKVIELAKVLAGRQKKMKLYVVPFAKVQELLKDNVPGKWLVLLYRRAMVRIAEKIARDNNIKALVTGESLGQVASQTLENITVVEESATMPILRPLIAMDKIETINIAKDIGTFDISIQPHDDCCTLFVPKHPETKGSVKMVVKYESQCDWKTVSDEAALNAELIEL